MKFLRKFLFPFIPFYYIGSLTIKKLYDWNILKSQSYNFPVITVGNMSVGGTGKSPFVAYLIEHLQKNYKVATLSRGYKRTSRGFQIATEKSTFNEIGDEPLQFKTSYAATIVSVDTDRKNGIHQLQLQNPKPEVIILDDAYQHRKVSGGFQILLTAYYNLYSDDWMLPAGDLREPISGAARANVIIVSKCPKSLNSYEQAKITKKIAPLASQKIYFTSINYSSFICNYRYTNISSNKFFKNKFCLVTGIAEPFPLVQHLKSMGGNFAHLKFSDHHIFTEKEIENITKNERILTTQKDFMRLKGLESIRDKLYYLPITIEFLNNEDEFNKEIAEFMLTYY